MVWPVETGRILYSLLVTLLFVGPQMGGKQGKLVEKWETRSGTLEMRVIAREEMGTYMRGTFYNFESRHVGSSTWQQVMTFRHDDRPAIPTDHIQFVNDQIAYVFMGWMYAVTIDGGANWSVWDATTDLLSWQCCNYGLIDQVAIESDGAGTMKLRPIEGRSGEVSQLHTSDFGRHWSVK